MDELASIVGCAPNIAKLFITDTWLALNLWFGPYYPYVFRLSGPNSWNGARDAILSAKIRIRCGMLGVNQLNKTSVIKYENKNIIKYLILNNFSIIIGLALGLYFFLNFLN